MSDKELIEGIKQMPTGLPPMPAQTVVPCPLCKGTGGQHSSVGGVQYWKPCENCGGAGMKVAR